MQPQTLMYFARLTVDKDLPKVSIIIAARNEEIYS